MDIFKILDQARQVETTAGALYRAAAQRFSSDGTWRDLFLSLAREEDQHALRVEMLAKRLSQDPLSASESDLDNVDLTAALDAGNSFLDRLKGDGELSLDDALTGLTALETTFAAAHADVIMATAHASARRFFEQLAAQDEAHANLLALRPATAP